MPNERFQSTLPARGATNAEFTDTVQTTISIHAPREGSDILHKLHGLDLCNFNPRSPRGERPLSRGPGSSSGYFNPRSPRGERRVHIHQIPVLVVFQSTLPARGATGVDFAVLVGIEISIHAPREGSDLVNLHIIGIV